MSEIQPAFLIDVDGPLNAYGLTFTTAFQRGYSLFQVPLGKNTYQLWLNCEHGPMLSSLAEYGELMWCTAWENHANELIAPRIGLPELPVIDVGEPKFQFETIWKRPAVQQALPERPFAWFDDQFEDRDYLWAQTRTGNGTPTLLIDVQPTTGLSGEHIEKALRWARNLTPAAQEA